MEVWLSPIQMEGKDHECCRFHPQRSELQRNRFVYEGHASRTGLRVLCAGGPNTRSSRHNLQIAQHLRVRRTAAGDQGLLGLADNPAAVRARGVRWRL